METPLMRLSFEEAEMAPGGMGAKEETRFVGNMAAGNMTPSLKQEHT